MAAKEAGRRWNDRWWQEVAKQKKTALPATKNVRGKQKRLSRKSK